MTKSPRIAGFTYKYFELLSWMFTIIMIVSLVYSGIAVYNLSVHGNCSGPAVNGTLPYCPLTGTGGAQTCETTNNNCTKEDCACVGEICRPECKNC